MSDFPGFSDLERIGRDEILVRNARISQDAVEREGTDANIFNALASAAADECVGQLADVEAGLFLDSAKATALDRLVFDRYGLKRRPAAPAVGQVVFSLNGGGPNPGVFTISAGTVLSTADGIQFTVTSATLFPFLALSVTVPVQSVLAGISQQAKVGTITSILSTITGAPASPTQPVVTNTLATAGADDAEEDDSLRNRARLFFSTARRGTIQAIRAGALAVPGVRTAEVFEVLDSLGRPSRFVSCIVSDAFTSALVNLNPTPPTYEAQSQAFSLQVFNGLSDIRAAGIFVQVQVALVVLQPVFVQVSFLAGVDVDATVVQARASVVNYTNALAPGEIWSLKAAQKALRSTPGVDSQTTGIVSPSGDVVPQNLQVIRTSLDLVSVSTSQSTQNLSSIGGAANFFVTSD